MPPARHFLFWQKANVCTRVPLRSSDQIVEIASRPDYSHSIVLGGFELMS
jgi:hypothetical protein